MPNQTNIDERFYLQPGETPEAYRTRTSSYFGSGQTIGDLYRAPNANRDYEEGLNYYKKASRPVNERSIRSNVLSQFQKEIDATNQIYAQKLAEVKQQGLSRLGSSRATQARSGLLGSDFGAAQTDKVEGANSDIENLVRAELSSKISEIVGKANKIATDDIAAKRIAQEQGVEKYLEYLGKKSQTVKSNVNALALDLYNKGLTPDSIGEKTISQIAKTYGVNVADIKAAFDETKINQDTLKEKTALEKRKTEADISKSEFQTIGDGAYLYNSRTGEMIINPQDFSPNSGSGSGSSTSFYAEGDDPVVDAWVRNIKAGKAKISDIPAKNGGLRDRVSQGLAVISAKNDLSEGYKLATDLLNRDTDAITGIPGGLGLATNIPGTQAQYTKNIFNQLKGYLALENRQKLKGSGAISDFEAGILDRAASSLNTNLSNSDFKSELKKVRGVLGSLNGVPATVKITNPETGESKVGNATREEINEAFAQGFNVEYQ